MKTRCALSFLMMSMCMTPALASADEMFLTRGEPVEEIAHRVRVGLEEGVVTYRVRRAFANDGRRPEEVILNLEMPPGGQATGLRIRGAGGRWYQGQLLRREEAEARYREMTGVGEASVARDPALLHWEGADELTLQVFPVPAQGVATVEYTLRAPARYVDGVHVLGYPRPNPALAGAVLEVTGEQDWRVGGRRLPPDRTIVLTQDMKGSDEDARHVSLIASPPRPHRDVVGRYGLASAGEHQFARVEWEAPARFGRIPEGLQLVFALDASYSMGREGVEAQVELVRATLAHVPEARVEVIAYRRTPERLFGEFLDTPEALARLEQLQHEELGLGLGNGSELNAAVALARQAFDEVDGTRYLIAMTDDRLSSSWEAAALREAAGEEVLMHVVESNGYGQPRQERDDAHRLAGPALATGGIFSEIWGDEERRDELGAVALGLLRPIRLDGARVNLEGISMGDFLDEGQGFQALLEVLGEAPGRLALEGKLWAKPVKYTSRRRRSFDRHTAGLVFAEDMHGELSADEQLELATFARAVSPQTSLLAIDPGVVPSVEGISRIGGMGGWGSGFGRAGCGVGIAKKKDQEMDVHGAALSVARSCALRLGVEQAWAVSVRLELTGTEIVGASSERSDPMAQCVVEGLWAFDLGRWKVIHDPDGVSSYGPIVHELALKGNGSWSREDAREIERLDEELDELLIY